MGNPILAVALLLTISAAGVSAQAPAPARKQLPAAGAARRQTERILFRLEEEWARAVVRRDATAFRRLLSPSFVYTENERVMGKEELIREITFGSDTVDSAGNEDMKAYVYGTTGIVTGILMLSGRGKDGPFSRRFRYTDTWVYRGGRWQVVAAQDYLLPE